MEEEIWKSLDFLDYPNYEVSTLGRVKSLNYRRSGEEKILKSVKHKDGYILVNLCKNAKGKCFKVHRLVATVFLKNENNYPCVNHIDENKENNRVENLEWVTHEQNTNYGTRNERASKSLKGRIFSEEHKQKMSEAKKGHIAPNRKPILQFSLEGVFIREWESVRQVEKELKINSGNITSCCKEKRKSAGDFIWKYKEI